MIKESWTFKNSMLANLSQKQDIWTRKMTFTITKKLCLLQWLINLETNHF